MMTKIHHNIIITGNPNSGKTSLFNILTGLNHKVGNYPGVTVEKKSGQLTQKNFEYNIIDIPGTYSLYPKSLDEAIAYKTITDSADQHPDNHLNLLVVDAAHLKRNLFFATQIIDLGLPTIIALTMMDTAQSLGINIQIDTLSQSLGVHIIPINSKTGEGINELKDAIKKESFSVYLPQKTFINDSLSSYNNLLDTLTLSSSKAPYLTLHQHIFDKYYTQKENVTHDAALTQMQTEEIKHRYTLIESILEMQGIHSAHKTLSGHHRKTYNLDKILLHPILGYVIMFVILYVVFQSVFWLAKYPMDFIGSEFSQLGAWVAEKLPQAWWSDLIVNGIIAGLGGVIIFVPQIAILFLFLTLLEDTGYISRISFLMDKLFQKVGLSGKSVVPLLNGMACAIPAVMAARTIENPKHRLITVLVTPFMSCSARLPVYSILISLIIPDKYIWGVIGYQGLAFMGLYLLGFVTALIASKILSVILYKNQINYFIQELPVYQIPRWKNALINMYEKSKVFLLEAGRVIMIISVALWFLLSYGPSKLRAPIDEKYAQLESTQGELTEEQSIAQQSELLESSYGGVLGKLIEPAIQPLGYDWKIGIALISSFAAREVFVGTMATIYSIGDIDDDDTPLKIKLQNEMRPDGTPVYSFATGVSLMLFYAFAMQCMATLAIVRRELNSWKWALIQLLGMTGLAYIVALIAYQVLK